MHVPVLQKEVLQYLDPKSNENFIDCTTGEGGHTAVILERNKPRGKVLGIELDPELYQKIKSRLAEIRSPKSEIRKRLILVQDSYSNLSEIVRKAKVRPISGILLDLGISSWHLQESKRGFSFQKNEELDMRYNPENPLTAEKILSFWSKHDIERILKEYGEERYAQIIAEKIVEQRKIKSIKRTFELVEIIESSVPTRYQRGRIHCATRTFQALRIAVNGELNNLKNVLPQTLEILKGGGRLVIISFHSLEDRIVKNFFKDEAKPHNKEYSYYGAKEGLPAPYFRRRRIVSGPRIKILTKKPIRPSQKEIKQNPRSRSAKLRAAIKL